MDERALTQRLRLGMPESIGPMPFETLLASLASKTPAPGGGAAAGMLGATAAAAAGMVVAYSLGRTALAEHQAFLGQAAVRLERAQGLFLTLADEDAQAYTFLNTLMKLPQTDPVRIEGWRSGVGDAMAVPRATLAAACDLLRLFEDLLGRINPHLRSDLAVAAIAAEGAARAAAWNVKINLPLLDAAGRGAVEAETDALAGDARARAARVEAGCV